MQVMAALSEVLEYFVVVSYHSVFSSLCNRSELVALHDFGNAKGWVHRDDSSSKSFSHLGHSRWLSLSCNARVKSQSSERVDVLLSLGT